MIKELKLNSYYLVYCRTMDCELPGKLICKDVTPFHKMVYLIEFIDFVDGHRGYDYKQKKSRGKIGHCWWVNEIQIIRELTEDEVMVELL